jgi:MFS family permease
VFYLGLTSLFTDISSEMVSSVLPIYLVFALHRTPLQFGVIDGLYQGAAVVVRLASGVLADRWRRNREVAAAGYALSAAAKLGLLAAGNAWTLLAGILVLDRIGKGVRTAPRDALISLSSAPGRLASAFGVHRTFDTAGALLGPLVAFGILAVMADAYDVVFVSSFCLAAIGLAALLLFVENPQGAAPGSVTASVSLGAAVRLLRGYRFRALLIAGALLGLVTIGDSFLYLGLQRRLALDVSVFPLLYVATALVYLALAIPAGRLADRIGRGRVFLGGHALLLLAYLGLLLPAVGPGAAVLCLGLLGAYYAGTDGVLMAIASRFLPANLRTSGLALLTTATGVTRFLASVTFGALWSWASLETAVALFLAGLAAALVVASPAVVRMDGIAEDEHAHAA